MKKMRPHQRSALLGTMDARDAGNFLRHLSAKEGADTLDANLMLGLPADARNYRIASTMLDALGVSEVCLLSNNPDKAKQLEEYGINVAERKPLIVGVVNENRDYLQTKAERMGHQIDLDGE